ncbi:hypothetical protein D9M69_632760 [compost metagenome]
MEHFVGLDVSQDITHVCVIGSDGKPVWQGTCLSTPEGISAAMTWRALVSTTEKTVRPARAVYYNPLVGSRCNGTAVAVVCVW